MFAISIRAHSLIIFFIVIQKLFFLYCYRHLDYIKRFRCTARV